MSLPQEEADRLIEMEKRFVDSDVLELSQSMAMDYVREMTSLDGRERSLLDVWRSRRRTAYLRYQTRARQCIILARLDIDGPRHRNPPLGSDAEARWLSGTHLHLYREGYDDRIAFELADVPDFSFTTPLALTQTFAEFLGFCHVAESPAVQLTL